MTLKTHEVPWVQARYVARTGTGHTPSRNRAELWVPDECTIPWFTLADVWQLRDGTKTVITETAERVSARGIAESAAVVHPAGTVLLSRTASVGFAGVMGCPMAVSQDFMTWTPGPRLDSTFLVWALRAMTDRLHGLMYGSTHKTIYMPDLSSLRIPLPPLDQQQRIARFLDGECARIDRLDRKLAESVQRLGAIGRQQIATMLDDDARAGRVKIGRHLTVLSGYAFPSSGFVHDEERVDAVRLLRGINVGVGVTRWADVVRWPKTDVAKYDRWRLSAGDLVLGMDRPWIGEGLRVAELDQADLPALLLQRVACLRPSTGRLSTAYVRLWLEHDLFEAEVSGDLTGVSVPHISPTQIAGYRVAVPSRDRQLEVVDRARRLSTHLVRLSGVVGDMRARLAEYRRSLITEVVNGRTDLLRRSDVESQEAVEAVVVSGGR